MELQEDQLVFSKLDNAEVTISTVHRNGAFVIGAGRVTEFREFSTLTPLEPRKGDTVRVTGFSRYSKFPELGVAVGDERSLTHYLLEKGRDFPDVSFAGIEWNGKASVILLRRATPEAKGGAVAPALYVPQKGERVRVVKLHPMDGNARCHVGDVLTVLTTHEYLIDHWGTGWVSVQHSNGLAICHVEPVEIQPTPSEPSEGAKGWEPKVGDWVEGKGVGDGSRITGCVSSLATSSFWRTPNVKLEQAATDGVPSKLPLYVRRDSLRPISPPPAGSADSVPQGAANTGSAQPVGGGSSKSDPYAECRQRDIAAAMYAANSGLAESAQIQHSGYLLWQSQQRKLEQAKQADRPATSRHPADWESEDADELYSTL